MERVINGQSGQKSYVIEFRDGGHIKVIRSMVAKR